MLVVYDGGAGRHEDAEPDRVAGGGGLAVVHPAPVHALVRDGQAAHLQPGQQPGHLRPLKRSRRHMEIKYLLNNIITQNDLMMVCRT